MLKQSPLSPPRKMAHLFAFILAALWVDTSTAATAADEYAAAAALGVLRNEGSEMVSIDFDVPRYGPLCITVDEGATLNITWDEYHNLYRMLDEDSFENCDFSNAMAIMSEGKPRPDGITFSEATAEEGSMIINAPSYYACRKICASNGHKVKVCRGGTFGQANECSETTECSSDRTVDMRRMPEAISSTPGSREYIPVGKVCRPKNGDGYSITSGVDTPESCRKKCDDDASKCGAWEFEDHDLDNKECELHEIEVISYEETMAMGDCERPTTVDEEDYRCCWIAREIVEGQAPMNDSKGSALPTSGQTIVLVYSMATIVALLASGI